jgi:hypothetical protein
MMRNTAAHGVESRAEPLDLHAPTASMIERLSSGLCWGGLLLFVISLLLPAIRVQGQGEWVAGDLGCVCLFLSLAVFPCWVPHALMIAAPFIGMFAGKTATKATGVVLALTTLTILQTCIPNVIATGFRQGLLAGFWSWAFALVTTTAGLLIGGFSQGRTPRPLRRSVVFPAGHERSWLGILLCWGGLALYIVMNLRGLSFYFLGSVPQRVASGGIRFVQDPLVVPAMLAMAPVVCTYASGKTQRVLALALGAVALFPYVSVTRPAEQPVEVLAHYLLSYLNVAVSVAGLLVSAGFLNRRATALRKSAKFEVPEIQTGAPETSVSCSNPPLGASLCWVALAHFLGLGSLPLAFLQANEAADTLISVLLFNSYLGYSLLAMAPLVCTFCGPLARRVLGALLALQVVVGLPTIWWFGLSARPSLIAFGLSAAGLLSMDVLAGKKGKILPNADEPTVPHSDHSSE